jgi:hypothetical protein
VFKNSGVALNKLVEECRIRTARSLIDFGGLFESIAKQPVRWQSLASLMVFSSVTEILNLNRCLGIVSLQDVITSIFRRQ